MERRMLRLLSLSALFALTACKSDDPVAPAAVVPTPVVAQPLPAPPVTSVLDIIALPVRPEAIARGNGTTFYAGSSNGGPDTLINGMIVRGDFKTGVITTLVPAVTGKATSGLVFDPRSNLLYATETRGGAAGVYNATTGTKVTTFTFPVLAAPGNQINDVALGPDAVYFTNSFQPVMFRVALGVDGTPAATFTTITLSGDYVHAAAAKPFNVNSNGIAVTTDGQYVLLDNMGGNKGVASANCIASPRAPADSGCVSDILRVDPATGVAKRISVGGNKIYFVDGMRLYDHTLYVAQNFMDKITVFTLSVDYLTATFVKDIVSPNWIVPSSMVVFENSVFAINAGFGPGPYQVSRMAK
jgi:hypothetical protein